MLYVIKSFFNEMNVKYPSCSKHKELGEVEKQIQTKKCGEPAISHDSHHVSLVQ
jgi:hypothetical protein